MKNVFQLSIITAVVILFSCTNAGTDTEQNRDTTAGTTTTDTSSMPAYDPAMDPFNAGGSLIKKVGDSLNIKMYEVILKPGDSAELHTHPDHTLYVLQGGKLAINIQGQPRQVLDLPQGMGVVLGPETHSGKNIGNTTIRLLVHDVYRPLGNRQQ